MVIQFNLIAPINMTSGMSSRITTCLPNERYFLENRMLFIASPQAPPVRRGD